MSRRFHWLYAPWQWLIFVPLVVILTVLGAALAIPLSMIAGPGVASRTVAANWARLVTWLAPARVRVRGRENLQPGQSYVVVSNHRSQFDIPVVYGFSGLDMRWIMKAEVLKIPLIGRGAVAVGHVPIRRDDPDDARERINRVLSDIRGGKGILFFAEGTRSRDGTLGRFKKGAFRVAIDRQLPILPITINGTRRIMPPGTIKLVPGEVELVIHPPVSTEGKGVDDLPAVRDEVRRAVESALAEEPLD